MSTDHTFAPQPPQRQRSPLLAGLDPAQLEAVTIEAAPLCILAGAGSGKTRVLTRRIAHRVATGSALSRHVLALTFTRRAAGELGRRLGALGVRDRVAAGTFHAIAYAQLRRRWADRGERAPAVLDAKVRLLAALLPRRPGLEVQPGELAVEIEWAKARLVTPEGYGAAVAGAGRRPPIPADAMSEVYARYEEEKRRRRLVDLDDLVLRCAEVLEADAEFAATQRWRFRHLFVDEFQDVNPAQLRLLDAWRGTNLDLCVVGDPDQAIYAWNGADPTALTGFPRRFPEATVVHLDRTYRSTPQIVTVANAVLDGWRAPGARHLRPTRPPGALPTVVPYATDRDEATSVARALRRRRGTRPWSELAVLSRTRAQLVLFEEALLAAGVPFRVRGTSTFLDRPEVRAAVADLKSRPPDIPLTRAVTDFRLPPCPEPGPAGPGGAAASEASTGLAEAERRAGLAELVRMADEQVVLDPATTVGGFLVWLTTALRSEAQADADAVDLATFHSAKGLEWPVVFVTGLETGLVPVGHAETPEARAEERRLLYVAVTRAVDELHCSWAERRTFGSRSMARSPSPWVADLESAVSSLASGGPDVDWRRHLHDTRARVRAAGGVPGGLHRGERASPAVLTALRSWRAGAARAAGVPAFVVLHDSTLAAVAEACPGDREELLALPGMGPVRAQRYGDALLAVVAGATAASA